MDMEKKIIYHLQYIFSHPIRYIKFKKWKVAICKANHLCQHPNNL